MATENKIHINWYRSPLTKEELHSLTKRSNLHGLLQIITQLLLTFALGAVAYYVFYHYAWYIFMPVFFIYATVYSFLGLSGAGHELSHGTVFKSRSINEFFVLLISLLSWTNMHFFRTSHTKHHQLTLHNGLDLEVVQPLKYQPFDWVKMFTFNWSGLKFVFTNEFRRSLGIIKGEWEERIYPPSEVEKRRALMNWSRFILIGQLLIAAVFIYFQQYVLLLLVTFAPFFAGWLNFLCGFTQHAGLPPDIDDYRIICRTMTLNPLLRFLYWHMNYHVEHHMYPGVPFFRLGALRKTIVQTLPPAYPGLIACWRELRTILRKQHEDASYVYYPEVPGKG